jgi:hypothetical protein
MINATSTGGTLHEPIPAGTYVARCYMMIHIGTTQENIKGELKWLNKVRVSFELPTELKEFRPGEGEKPFVIDKEFTLSMYKTSNLRKFLEGWRGKAFTDAEAEIFDVTKLLGVPGMISIIHQTSAKGNVYADISSCSSLPKGLECPPAINKLTELNYEDHWDANLYSKLPDFIKDKMAQSKQFRAMMNPEVQEMPADHGASDSYAADPIADDLPF